MFGIDSKSGARTRKVVRPVALLAAFALVSAACGARVPPYLNASTAGAPGGSNSGLSGTGSSGSGNSGLTGGGSSTGGGSLGGTTSGGSPGGATAPGAGQASTGGSTGGTQTAAGGTSSGGTTAPAGGGAQPSGGGGSTGGSSGSAPATVASLNPSNFSYNPQQQADYCQGTNGNTASAPGVTPTSITVGNVSGLTGAVSNTFNAGPQAVTAVFDAINHFGGICGRQLKLQTDDDQQSSSNNENDVASLIPNVLAFVGSVSDADNGGVPDMVSAGVPDLGPAINVNRSNAPVYWSASGGSVTVRNGRSYLNNAWINGLKANNELPSQIAILSYNISISAQAGQEYATAFQQAGSNICYSNYNIPPAPGAEMGSVVQSMQQKGCNGVFTTMDIVGNADMLDDMQNDNYHPGLVAATYESYNPAQISLAGQQAAQNLDVFLASVALNDPVPGVQLYNTLMSDFEPGQPLSEFGLEAWADAEMFVYALLKAGRNPTRQSLSAALQSITNWTSDGAFGAYTPSNRTGAPCTTNVVVKGSSFVRQWPSGTGEYCNGSLVDVGPAS